MLADVRDNWQSLALALLVVCVLGYETWEKLFKQGPALGQDVRIGDYRFTVVGVAEKKGAFLGQSQDDFVIIPLGAMTADA